MPALNFSSPTLRRVLRLTGYVLLTLLVYWLNAVTPPTARLGILYIIPVLLVTWTEGLVWGIVFAAATTGLRETIAWVQMPADTPMVWRVVTGLAYLAVLGDRKSTRLNSSHLGISYAVFCLKKKKQRQREEEKCVAARLEKQVLLRR